MTKEPKGIALEVDIGKVSAPLELAPPIKQKLEQDAKLPREYRLETFVEKLQRAATIREALKQLKEEKLRCASQEREEKVKRKRSDDHEEKKEQVARLVSGLQQAEQRRIMRIKELVGKLQDYHEKVTKAGSEANEKKESRLQDLRMKLSEKLAEYRLHREKCQQERVKRLEEYHTRLNKAVLEAKNKEEEKKQTIARAIELKLQVAHENKMKRIQEIKALAVEVADKVKKIQVFVYEGDCTTAQ